MKYIKKFNESTEPYQVDLTIQGEVYTIPVKKSDREKIFGDANSKLEDLLEDIGLWNSEMGRVACVKFDNILDGLALFTNEVKINLPLNTGKNDQPIIYPSKYLMKFIDEFNPLTTPISMNDTGFYFFFTI